MEAHVIIWLVFIILGLTVHLCNGNRDTFSMWARILFAISCFFAGLSILAGFIRLFLNLIGF